MLDHIPAALREPVQQIVDATGEAFETVVAVTLSHFGAQLRRHRTITDHRDLNVYSEPNVILIRPEGQLRLPWYDILGEILRAQDSYEQAMLEYYEAASVKRETGATLSPANQ